MLAIMAKDYGINTKLVHAGEIRDPRFGNVTTPIFENSTFLNPNKAEGAYIDSNRGKPFLYTRSGNPTIQSLEEKYAAAEGTDSAMAFSSGMAAISTAVLSHVKGGGKILSISDLYGQTHHFFSRVIREFGIAVDFIPLKAMNSLDFKDSGYSMVYAESITNPLLGVLDVKKVGSYCREIGVPFVIDATFATPVNQNAGSYGASIVLHSGTKYIGGHSDILLGLAGFSSEIREKMAAFRKSLGGVPDPFQAYLALRGLKTLSLRVHQQNRNALEIARYLEDSRYVERVYYPGLESFEYHKVALENLRGFGGMVSFEIKGDHLSASRFTSRLKLVTSAPSLGGVESLATIPADTSHSALSREERLSIGIRDNLIRLSVGIEESDDLIRDIEQALEGSCSSAG